jgi:hypothetical protein
MQNINKNKYLLIYVTLAILHDPHPPDSNQCVEDLRQTFLPCAASAEARGDGVLVERRTRFHNESRLILRCREAATQARLGYNPPR